MAGGDGELSGPDLVADGVAEAELADGAMLLGHAHGGAVLLARRGQEVHAIAASCSHYGGPLAEGLFDGACVRCPWHHAAFDVRTGEAARPPALSGVARYEVSARDGRWYVGAEAPHVSVPAPLAAPPASVVILGAGAAGNAAAETLRREGYDGAITMIGAEDFVPPDRPNLSKDYLAGSAPEEWLPLHEREFYAEHHIELRLGVSVTAIDTAARQVVVGDRERFDYGALLLATGAEPVRLNLPGSDRDHVFTLRSVSDSRAIIARAEGASRAVVLGASFIGLEVAAALRTRELEVHVVAPEDLPFATLLGAELGRFVQELHEEHGVIFHLGRTASSIGEHDVTLDDGSRIEAELVVMGVGVRPRLALVESAGLAVDDGVLVDEFLRTSAEGVWAAGDIASWPHRRSGVRVRVEHWVVAERQGVTAARNMLGRAEPYRDVPFFWSQHYDVPINYVGHAPSWDEAAVSGSAADRDVVVSYRRAGRTLAVASIYRDADSLAAELAMEQDDEAALERLLPGA